MQLSDFHFDLPPDLIARYPATVRSQSRLLQLQSAKVTHSQFHDIIHLIAPGDLLIFNDTKVIPARLFAKKITGGKVEVLIERILDSTRALAQVRASKALQVGDDILFDHERRWQVSGRAGKFYEFTSAPHQTILSTIELLGHVPLPPYINRAPDESDKERYQTVYAKHQGSVAAPTAGFHFDESLLQQLQEKGVKFGYLTLHIGAGTFLPVREENITQHQMHAERFTVTEALCAQINATKARGNKVIAVGTTTLRALEAAAKQGTIAPFEGETDIFIYPGYQFHEVDVLITNFHLPGSTLLMLVAAFGGYERVMEAYRSAVAAGYHFFSYGDAMWLPRMDSL